MQSEVTVTIKSEDATFKKKFLCYEELTVTQDCMALSKMVNEALGEFKGTAEEILVKITARW